MLLITFCGKFCSFCKLFMPKLLIQSKHEEFESNSAFQISDQKERRVENAKKLELQEIWQANFRSLRNFCRLHCSSFEISFLCTLFILQPLFIHPTLLTSYAFYLFDSFLSLFCFLPNLSLVIAFDFCCFCNFAWLGQYISSYAL